MKNQTSVSKYGDAIIDYMNNDDYECWRCMWGDGLIVDACGHLFKGKIAHPMNIMQAAVNGLARDHRFINHKTHGVDSRCRERVVRSFELKPKFQNRRHYYEKSNERV